ncbi:MAG: FRG domain-containing protein [Pirellulales bacterium]|nr:FRG domain-containing protein [Pirellulales bacterium]
MNDDADKAQTGARAMKAVKAFLTWAEKRKGQSLLYRGLAYAGWDVESSAYRRIEKPGGSELFPGEIPGVFKNYISQLLEKASMRDFRAHEGNELSDLKLLARLQHHGAATCLIDFTQNPLVALWFACQEHLKEDEEQNGKVIVMDTGADATISDFGPSVQMQRTFNKVGPKQLAYKEGEIVKLLYDENLWEWEPTPRESRVIAQQSIFVFGSAVIGNHYYEEVHVPASAKEGILHVLDKKFGINEASLFGDFTGFALANAHDKHYEERSAHEYYGLAESSFKRGDKAKAIYYCGKAIEQDPQHLSAYSLRGWCNYFLKNHKKSVKDFSEAIGIDDTNMKLFMDRARVYAHGLKNPKEAVNDYTVVIDFSSTSKNKIALSYLPAAYRFRGLAYAEMEEHENAIADFISALKIRPDWTAIYFEMAESCHAMGDEKGARAAEEKAERVRQRARQRLDNRRRRGRPRDA